MRKAIKRLVGNYLQSKTRNSGVVAAHNHTLVFAPHPDDETLGCGGTIALKRQGGEDVAIVFMTDGCDSHDNLIAADQLKEIRQSEAMCAAATLGVEGRQVTFLDFPDGSLKDHEQAAVEKVVSIILSMKPHEVYIPHDAEAPTDHWVTNKIVFKALRRCPHPVVVREYPVWLWLHWPWVTIPRRVNIQTYFKRNLAAFYRLVFGCNVVIGVSGVLAQKRQALDCHRTQMTRYNNSSNWPILADVADGEFLAALLSGVEIFRETKLTPNR